MKYPAAINAPAMTITMTPIRMFVQILLSCTVSPWEEWSGDANDTGVADAFCVTGISGSGKIPGTGDSSGSSDSPGAAVRPGSADVPGPAATPGLPSNPGSAEVSGSEDSSGGFETRGAADTFGSAEGFGEADGFAPFFKIVTGSSLDDTDNCTRVSEDAS